MIGALFLDFRKAFDLEDHSILLKKIAICKFSPLALQLPLRSYRPKAKMRRRNPIVLVALHAISEIY